MQKGIGKFSQIVFVVRDIEAAMKNWVNMGVGPWFFVSETVPDNYIYRGKPGTLRISTALTYSGDLQIALLQDNSEGPTFYKEEMLNAGLEGMHVSFFKEPDDFDSACNQLLASGYKPVQSGGIAGPEGKFAYFDHEQFPGIVIEVSSVGGEKGEAFKSVEELSKDWDGSDPIRRVG